MAKWSEAPVVQSSAPKWQQAPTVDQPSAPQQQPAAAAPETYGESTFAQGASGANEGLAGILGMPIDLATAALNLGGSAVNAIIPPGAPQIPQIKDPFLGSGSIRNMMTGTGAIRPPTTDPGKQFLRRTMQDVGAGLPVALATGGGSLIPQLLMSAGSGAAGAAAEQLAPGNDLAEIAAQLLGAWATKKAGDVTRRAITPFPTSVERSAAAQTMANEGVDLTAGQATGSKGLQYAESELGGGTAAPRMEQQAEQFTQAALRKAGINAPRATPDVIDGAFTRIGNEFNDIASRNVINGDQQLVQDIGQTWRDYTSVVNPTQRAPLVENTIRDVMNALNTNQGVLSGEAYAAMRSQLGNAARAARYKDNQLADALDGLQEALDSAMARGLTPDDAAALTTARQQYRNLLVVSHAAAGAGENIALGLLSPASIANASKTIYGRRGYVRGRGDLTDLSHAGVGTMSPLPQSGTVPRAAARGILTTIGAGVGGSLGNIPGAIAGAAAGAAVPWAAGKTLLSPLMQRYLANQLMRGGADNFAPLAPMAGIANQLMQPKQPLQITVNGGGLPPGLQ